MRARTLATMLLALLVLPLEPAVAAVPEFANATSISAKGTASIRMRVPRGRYQTVSPDITLYTKARYLAVSVQHVARDGTLTHVWSGIGLGGVAGCPPNQTDRGYCETMMASTSWKPFMKSGDDYVITVSGPPSVVSTTTLFFVGLPGRGRRVTAAVRGAASFADQMWRSESEDVVRHGTFAGSLARKGVLIGGTWSQAFTRTTLPLTGSGYPGTVNARASCFAPAPTTPDPIPGDVAGALPNQISDQISIGTALALASCNPRRVATLPSAGEDVPRVSSPTVGAPATSGLQGVSASLDQAAAGAYRFGWAVAAPKVADAQHGAFALWLTLPTRA